jgi:hypothetical protein
VKTKADGLFHGALGGGSELETREATTDFSPCGALSQVNKGQFFDAKVSEDHTRKRIVKEW